MCKEQRLNNGVNNWLSERNCTKSLVNLDKKEPALSQEVSK